MTPELMLLRSNEEISNSLIKIAVGIGKSEEVIRQALNAAEREKTDKKVK